MQQEEQIAKREEDAEQEDDECDLNIHMRDFKLNSFEIMRKIAHYCLCTRIV